VIDCVEIGTAIISYIEPHAGLEREFNRWYERDHFPAAVTAGPGVFAGSRWVAPRALKAQRPSAGRFFGDPARGSYLGTAWVLPGMQPAWDAFGAEQMKTFLAEDRMFPGRDHIHTGIYRYRTEVRAPNGPYAALALDHGFDGVVSIALVGDDVDEAAAWLGKLVRDEVPVAAVFSQEKLLVSVLDEPITDPASHLLVLAFVSGDVPRVFAEHVEPALAGASVGFASPFIRTIPGTDKYTDQL
jgi:hypothetical protein